MGGEVLIAVSNSIPSRQVVLSHNIDFVAVDLFLHLEVLLCCVYVPSSSSNKETLSLLNSLSNDYNLII